jgi:hypothetical protein
MIHAILRSAATAAILAGALAACGDRAPQPPDVSEVLPNLPLPPAARFVSRSGGEEALQLTVRSPMPRAEVESYYKETLNKGRWKLVNQARDRDGALVILARQDGPPLWVRIRADEDTTATLVDFLGARTDTTAKPAS